MFEDTLHRRLAKLSPAKRALVESRLVEKGFSVPAVPRRGYNNPSPLSFAQQRLWFLNELEPGGVEYNMPLALRVKGALDVAALERSLDEIVLRHEVLRTRFVKRAEEPVQIVDPALKISLRLLDLTRWAGADRESEAWRIAREEGAKPFDLERGPLFKAKLMRLSEDDHVLLLLQHHIVSDGWSLDVLYRELSILYGAFFRGKLPPLAELPIQYADYAVWQREWLEGAELERQLTYWKKQLEGAPRVLALPTDRPRPAVQSYRGQRQSAELSKNLSEKLKKFSRKEGVTLYMTLLAAFQLLLYRYTGQEDIVVGSPIANRTRAEIEGLIGFFVNTLVLRSKFTNNPTFKELLVQVREVALGAYAHQDLPFEKLVEELAPQRNLSHSPLFQVMFVLQNVPSSETKFEGLSVSPVRIGAEMARFDLTLSVQETPECLRASLGYRTDLFEESTIERMLGHYQTLLEGVVANPDRRISELQILTEAEKRQLLVEWNDTRTEYPREKCIHELFETQVEKTPDAVAVVFEEKRLTFGELNERANQLAHYLRGLGVGAEVLVGVCMERSIEMVVGLLGILKAGGAYVPLDPNYPNERLKFIVEDIKTKLILTQQHIGDRFVEYHSLMVCLDQVREQIERQSPLNPTPGRETCGRLAYINYTSGSTGIPNGVMIEHRSLVNYLCWFNNSSILESANSLPFIANPIFDASLKQLFAPLLRGDPVWILDSEEVRQPSALLKTLSRRNEIGLNCVPSLWRATIDILESKQLSSEAKSLSSLLSGGEQLTQDLVDRTFALLPDIEIWNLYGPTEATANVCAGIIRPLQPITIGRPIANTQLYILDSHVNPVPIGVSGELHIGGAGLARGYLNRPGLTADKFITRSFDGEAPKRLYKTGDLARYLPDGNIEFLGRIDSQTKIRGYRVELGEIETALSRHPMVRSAAVLAREDVPGDRRLVAYIVPAAGQAPSTSQFRDFLKQTLPEYMVPAVFMILESLPVMPNGKLDRKALPGPDQSRPELDEGYGAPRTPVEESLAQIWTEVIGVRQVGVHDNFFDLGGHSLMGIRLMSRVNKDFQLNVPLRRLYEFPTVASLAESLNQDLHGGRASRPWRYIVELKPGSTGQPVFFFPGGAGGDCELIVYARLTHLVKGKFAFYGLRPRSADGNESAHFNAEEMVSDYLQEIQRVQPEGPYYLIGHCVGGIVAYETAQQLKGQGQAIALLALMDTGRPTPRRCRGYRFRMFKDRVKRRMRQVLAVWKIDYYRSRVPYHWRQLRAMGWWKSLAYVFCKSATAVRQLPLGPSTATVATSDHSWKTRNEKLQIQNGYMATLLRYRPRPYLGRVVMLNDENSMAGDPTFGWSELISGKIEIRTSRGDHDSYIGEHAQSAAEMLEVCLNEVSIDILKAEERRKARNAGSDTGAPVVSRDRNAVGCVSPAGQITSGND